MGVCDPQRKRLSDLDTFEKIVRAHQGAVRAFLRRLLRDDALADELAQDTFLKAYRVRDQLPEVRQLRSWLYRIAYRTFLDEKRRSDRRDHLGRLNAGELTDLHSPSHSHSQGAAHAALDIAKAMESLPPERRACAMLSLALGHSHGEIAEVTGLPLGTVKSHIARAKAALQSQLKEYENADPS